MTQFDHEEYHQWTRYRSFKGLNIDQLTELIGNVPRRKWPLAGKAKAEGSAGLSSSV